MAKKERKPNRNYTYYKGELVTRDDKDLIIMCKCRHDAGRGCRGCEGDIKGCTDICKKFGVSKANEIMPERDGIPVNIYGEW